MKELIEEFLRYVDTSDSWLGIKYKIDESDLIFRMRESVIQEEIKRQEDKKGGK